MMDTSTGSDELQESYLEGLRSGLRIAQHIANFSNPLCIRAMLDLAGVHLGDVTGNINAEEFAKSVVTRFVADDTFIAKPLDLDRIAAKLIGLQNRLEKLEFGVAEVFESAECPVFSKFYEVLRECALSLAGIPTHFRHSCERDGAILDGLCLFCEQNGVTNGSINEIDFVFNVFEDMYDDEKLIAKLVEVRKSYRTTS